MTSNAPDPVVPDPFLQSPVAAPVPDPSRPVVPTRARFRRLVVFTGKLA